MGAMTVRNGPFSGGIGAVAVATGARPDQIGRRTGLYGCSTLKTGDGAGLIGRCTGLYGSSSYDPAVGAGRIGRSGESLHSRVGLGSGSSKTSFRGG